MLDFKTITEIVLFVIAIAGIIYRIGKTEQRLTDTLAHFEKNKVEEKETIKSTLTKVDAHLTQIGIHINPEMDKRSYDDRKDWERRIESKLDSLGREFRRD